MTARGSRLHAQGILHHVMIKGIEGHWIVQGDEDRDLFYIPIGTEKRGLRRLLAINRSET